MRDFIASRRVTRVLGQIFLVVLACSYTTGLVAQMPNGQDTLYGNEWIQPSQRYFKIPISEDGFYRINQAQLVAAGVPVETVAANQWQVWHLGQQVPLHISTDGALADADYLAFWAKKNRGEFDQYLYANPTDQFNPDYSLITDTAAYFLTWGSSPSGRYVDTPNDLTDVGSPAGWFWADDSRVFSNKFIANGNNDGVTESRFEYGEGYATAYIVSNSVSRTAAHPALDANVNATISMRLVASNGNTHELSVLLNDEVQSTENFSGVTVRDFSFAVPASELSSAQKIGYSGSSVPNDRYALGKVNLRYPRLFHFGNQSVFAFQLEDSQEKYLEIEGFDTNGGEVVLYDLTHGLRLVATVEGGLVKLNLPEAGMEARELVLVNETTGWEASEINEVDMDAIEAAAFVLITAPQMRAGTTDQVQAYADYRSSPEGRGFSTTIVEVQQLYDLFGYGINRHPQAFRNFAHFAKKNWTDFEYVFLVGKGREFDRIRAEGALSQADNETFFAPTFGWPGSDNQLVAGHESNRPIVPIGRIAARNPEEVEIYLDKVRVFETLGTSEEERSWRKQVMHLGGGGTPNEQTQIKNSMAQWAEIITDNQFGAEVSSFYKTSSDPIQQSRSATILNKINEGVGLISFYGHSGTGGFDFSIDDPSNWSNTDRYPLMMALGCLSGQIHRDFQSISERSVLQKERGSIAFLASVNLGYLSAMNLYVRRFYEDMGGDYYGASIGEMHGSVIEQLDNFSNLTMQSFLQQATIHGDPSLVITPFDKADYTIKAGSPEISPANPTAQQEDFTLNFDLINLGRSLRDSVDVSIYRVFPDGVEVEVIRDKVLTTGLETPVSYTLAVNGDRAIGYNRLRIVLDIDDALEEGPLPVAEDNNVYVDGNGTEGLSFYVFSNGTMPVYPPRYAIVSDPDVVLRASTADVFSANSQYRLELDTTRSFDSPWKQQTSVQQLGGVLNWTPSVNWENDQVYYWRVSLDSAGQQGLFWNESSFVYRGGDDPGWSHAHYHQLSDNEFVNKELPETTRELKYLDDVKSIKVKNGIYPAVWPEYSINNSPHIYIPYTPPLKDGIYVAVFDSLTGDPWWNNPNGDYGSILPNWATVPFYPFRTTTPEGRSAAINFLENVVPDGNYVMIYTVQWTNTSYEPETWAVDSLTIGTNLFQVLEAQGLNQLRQSTVTGAYPYIGFYRKGDTSYPAYDELGLSAEDLVERDFPITGIWNEGSVESVEVGPARSWDRCVWQLSEVEPLDEWSIEVIGVRENSSFERLAIAETGQELDLSTISATEYPQLRLRFNSMDTLNRTSPQLDYWRVYYDGLPDAALSAADFFELPKDTLEQGEAFRISYAVVNTSDYSMDSLEVIYQLGSGALVDTVATQLIPQLAAQDTATTHLTLDTREISGTQQLSIVVNPDRSPAERYYPNNFGRVEFVVEKDRRNPLLDVTFDGRHIINGDLVSAKPVIVIQLEDENEFLPLSDTSLLQVLLKSPNAIDVTPIALGSSEIQFFPATPGEDNHAIIEYRPTFTEPGIYTLFVQGQDRSGNASGQYDYKVDFEILLEEKVSNVFNYPNPFSTQTQFVYTLTGGEPPSRYVISIYTVSGRLVRTLTEMDLGPLRIGSHRTDGYWDGTDDYGQRLANGVYLYRVDIRQEDGSAYEKLDTNTDQFFLGNMGKMVLLR